MENLTVRDYLALDRTKLANHRTFLAYIRTMIMLFASGITFLKAFPDDNVMRTLAWILIPASIGVLLIGLMVFLIVKKNIFKRYSDVTHPAK
jgi:putative membrane protein